MDDPFDFPVLRIQQPGKLLANRVSYEIFNDQRQLLAVAAETEARGRRESLSKPAPDARVLEVTTAAREPVLTLTKHTRPRMAELHGPAGELIGRIRATNINRHYALLGGQGETLGKVAGDLALKHFSVTSAARAEFARVRKTWAGLAKEMLTPADHYKIEFTSPVSPPARMLTVMMAIVLDLTLYEPA